MFKQKGWKNPGYHFVVRRDGSIVQLLDVSQVSNGVKGYNHCSINVAYIGGVDAHLNTIDNRTDAQKKTMRQLVNKLKRDFPDADIVGHRDLEDGKDCPCFDVKTGL